jgi:serine protease Do
MKEEESNKFIAFLAIIATSFALGAFFLAWAPAQQYTNEILQAMACATTKHSNFGGQELKNQLSLFGVTSKGKGFPRNSLGLRLETDQSEKYPTTLITNHHVIEDCIGYSKITINLPYEDEALP